MLKKGISRQSRQSHTPFKILLNMTLLAGVVSAYPAHGAQCHQQMCTLVGTSGDDVLVGTKGDDVICGLDGNDTIKGKKGNDVICGGLGDDNIKGGKGNNILIGGRGDDTIFSKSSTDVLFGNQGKNVLHDQSGKATIVPGSFEEVVYIENSDTSKKTKEKKSKITVAEKSASSAEKKSLKTLAKSAVAEVAKAPARFTTLNNTIYAPDGSVFELKGVNIFPWAIGHKNVTGITDCWEFNSVRLHSWIMPDAPSQWKDHLVYVDEPLLFTEDEDRFRHYDIAPLIDIYTSKEIVVIVDIHEFVGKYFEGENLSNYIQFLEHFVNRYKDNPYVWIDLHNEPGGWDGLDGDFSRWRAESTVLMDTVRSISPDMMMIVSGTAWGQDTGPSWRHGNVRTDQSALLANSDMIQGYDNLITTFHMYDQWRFSYNRVKNYVDELLLSSDAPIYVGEYGSWNGSSTLSASRFLHTLLKEPGYEKIARSVWAWSAQDKNDLTTTGDGSGYLVDSCEAPTNLTPLGQLVWADNHQ